MSENEKVIANPLRAIRAKCLDCSGGSWTEVRNCPSQECELWPFRMGKNPFRKRKKLSEAHLQKLQEGREQHKKEKENE